MPSIEWRACTSEGSNPANLQRASYIYKHRGKSQRSARLKGGCGRRRMGWGGRESVGEGRWCEGRKKNEGIESASCVRARASSPEIPPTPPTTVGVVSRRGTLVNSGGSAARARGLMKSLVLAVERASPRSALGTKGARRAPPTCGRLQRRLREAFADCRVPQALLHGTPTLFFFVLFSREPFLGAETE